MDKSHSLVYFNSLPIERPHPLFDSSIATLGHAIILQRVTASLILSRFIEETGGRTDGDVHPIAIFGGKTKGPIKPLRRTAIPQK